MTSSPMELPEYFGKIFKWLLPKMLQYEAANRPTFEGLKREIEEKMIEYQ